MKSQKMLIDLKPHLNYLRQNLRKKTRMTIFIKTKFKKSDDQTYINKIE